MDAVGAGGQRDIGAPVDQDARPVRIRQAKHVPYEIAQLARRQIFLANLNALDATARARG